MLDHWSGNKIAWNLIEPPLPRIGGYEDLWGELVDVKLRLPRPDTAAELDAFLADLGPIILLHTRGNTGQPLKNCSADLEQDLYRELLDQTDASLVLLDWDNRVARLPHRRVKHLSDDFRRVNVLELGYLIGRAALLIGVDSGPLHLTRFTDCPALGLWFAHHPSHFSIPRATTAHIVGDQHGPWNRTRRHSFHVLDCPRITGAEVAKHATRALRGMTGRELVLAHCLDKLKTTTGQGYHDRHKTFRAVADHLRSKAYPRMVETGCSRVHFKDFDDWTAGHSTYLLALLLDHHGGKLDSVDIDPDNVTIARQWCEFTDAVEVHCSDSRDWLRAYAGPKLDVAYLDSADLGTPNYQGICLDEARLVLPHLAEDALILIDDSPYQAGKWHGKGGLAIPYLITQGFRIVYSGWQTLLSR